MIDPAYVIAMVRYNAWQNSQLTAIFESMSLEELTEQRGGFWGSILGTASHLVWGDRMWLSRFDPRVERPDKGLGESATLCRTGPDWSAARFRLDGQLRRWAEGLNAIDLRGDMTFFSGAFGREVTTPTAMNVVHMFNHQTHHRGQIHAMLTAAGREAPVTDLFIMPDIEDAASA
ncbi:DinB family protein [Sulfitobacter sp. LCG007]